MTPSASPHTDRTPAAPAAPAPDGASVAEDRLDAGPRPPRPVPPPRPPLTRPRECAVSGVAEGIARHLGAPVWAVRALFVVLAGAGGAGVLLYAWCWAFAPRAPGAAPVSRRVPVAWLATAAGGVGLLAVLVAMSRADMVTWVLQPGFTVTLPGPLIVVVGWTVLLAAGAGLWAALIDRRDPARGPRHAVTVRTVDAVVLVVAFVLTLGAVRDLGAAGVLVAFLPLAGLGLLVSSDLVARWRELSGERTRRIREEQRAEMAAHLHDSVLQTLALIQNRGGASSEVARLARAQERELRAWLYDGDQPADSDLPTDLRDYAAALELDFPVRIDVVTAGTSAERASGEVAAAAREAMLNAARHAGGEVSVYIEGRVGGVDVYVRDRGAGFDPEAVPEDRLGIRQSVVGRMRRVGGTATVTSGDGGTEVHLRSERDGGDGRG